MSPENATEPTISPPGKAHDLKGIGWGGVWNLKLPLLEKTNFISIATFQDRVYVFVLPCGIAGVVYWGLVGGGGKEVIPGQSFLSRLTGQPEWREGRTNILVAAKR
jgi:hypothetical protein